MISRVFKIRPRWLCWQVYIEAWQSSGMSQSHFCKEHGLCYKTFRKWRMMFEEDAEYKLEQLKKRRKKQKKPAYHKHSGKALQAFWAMHVEALWWSGLTVPAYAYAHRLSKYTLKKWRDKFLLEPTNINWRDLVHPSACPEIKARPETELESPPPMTKPMTTGLFSEISPFKDGRGSRRKFTPSQKRAIALESNLPNITVSDVARRYNIATSVLFRWRRELGFEQKEPAKTSPVEISDKSRDKTLFLTGLLPSTDGMPPVKLTDGRQVFVPQGSDPEEVKAYITSQEKPS